jgi:hypothetical protein
VTDMAGDWPRLNQRLLVAALAAAREALERHAAAVGNPTGQRQAAPSTAEVPDTAGDALEPPPALERMCTIFGLSGFERDLLLLCAGVELDAVFAAICSAAQGDTGRPYPTFSLAVAALAEPHWSALAPQRRRCGAGG